MRRRGSRTRQVVDDHALVVGESHRRGRTTWWSHVVDHIAPVSDLSRQQPQQVGRADDGGHDADGQFGRGDHAAGGEVGDDHAAAHRRTRPARCVTPGERTSRRAIGGETKATNTIGPAAAWPSAASATPTSTSSRRAAADSARRAPPQCRRRARAVERRPHQDRQRPQHEQPEPDQPHLFPAASVERTGHPDRGALDVVDLGAGDQVVDDGVDGEAEADARRAPAGSPSPLASRRAGYTSNGGDEAATDRADRHLQATAADVTIMKTAPSAAPELNPMTSGEPSGFWASDWKIAPDSRTPRPR